MDYQAQLDLLTRSEKVAQVQKISEEKNIGIGEAAEKIGWTARAYYSAAYEERKLKGLVGSPPAKKKKAVPRSIIVNVPKDEPQVAAPTQDIQVVVLKGNSVSIGDALRGLLN